MIILPLKKHIIILLILESLFSLLVHCNMFYGPNKEVVNNYGCGLKWEAVKYFGQLGALFFCHSHSHSEREQTLFLALSHLVGYI